MDLLLVFLKCATAIIAVILGVIGLLADFRHKKTKKMTRAGHAMLTAVIVSGIISVSVEGFSYLREQKRDAELRGENTSNRQKVEKAVRNSDRILQPLGNLELHFTLGVTPDTPKMKRALEWLRLNATGRNPHVTDIGTPDAPQFVVPLDLAIGADSPGFVSPQTITFGAEWYAGRVDAKTLTTSLPAPDLSFGCFLIDRDDGRGPFLFYKPKTGTFSVEGSVDKPFIGVKSGKLVSVIDLPGSTIVFRIVDKDPFTIENATISVAEGQSFDIPSFDHISFPGGKLFIFHFPADADFSRTSERRILRTYKINPPP